MDEGKLTWPVNVDIKRFSSFLAFVQHKFTTLFWDGIGYSDSSVHISKGEEKRDGGGGIRL